MSAIDVWVVDLDSMSDPEAWPDRRPLSPNEWGRSRRFATRQLRSRWANGRGAARRILSEYVGCSPHALRWENGAAGKPWLDHAGAPEFNLSHSGPLLALAVSVHGEVGIDVELVEPISDLGRLAVEMFTAGELEQFHALPRDRRLVAFYRCWTMKEALLKFLGQGLRIPLKDVRLDLQMDEAPSLLGVTSTDWSMESCRLGGIPIDRFRASRLASAVGALAHRGEVDEVILRTWTP